MKIHLEKARLLAVLQPKGFVQNLQPLTILQPHFHCAFAGKINIPANRQDLNQAKKFLYTFQASKDGLSGNGISSYPENST